jgi:hypothetical protein
MEVNGALPATYPAYVDYSLDVVAGDAILVGVSEVGINTSFWPGIRTSDSSGRELGLDWSDLFAINPIQVATSDRYTLRVFRGTAASPVVGGNYKLTVWRVPGTQGTRITNGTVAGTAFRGDLTPYTFMAGAGDHVSITIVETGTYTPFTPAFRLLGPQGFLGDPTFVTSSPYSDAPATRNFTPSADGIYTIFASRVDQTDTGGSYALTLSGATGDVMPVLTATRFDDHSVSLRWTTSERANGYTLKRGTKPGSETLLADKLSATSFTDGSAVIGTTYYYVVSARVGTTDVSSNEAIIGRGHTPGDFDGDGRADLTVYRPASGLWSIKPSSSNYNAERSYQWGLVGDVGVPGDYDGDGIADVGVYRPSTGYWYVLLSSSQYGTVLARQWGMSTDIPVPADYDGDGKTDLGLYRPSTGYWLVLLSGADFTSSTARQWGLSSDVPVVGDYDGDGKADLGLYRPSAGYWFVLLSGSDYTVDLAQQWGTSTDVPVPGDFDGDGRTDLALYRPSTGYWYILKSSADYKAYLACHWGLSTDIAVSGDYDGDGMADLVVYRPSNGYWYVLSSGSLTLYLAQRWGDPSAYPVTNPY